MNKYKSNSLAATGTPSMRVLPVTGTPSDECLHASLQSPVMYNASPFTHINYWRNCAEGV